MILIVKTVYGLFRMIKMKCIKFQAIPKRTITPIFPILDNIVQRYLTATIFGNNFSQFIKRFISFFRLPISESRFGKHRNFTCQRMIISDNFIHIVTCYKIIINLICHFRPKGSPMLIVLKKCFRIIVPQYSIRTS